MDKELDSGDFSVGDQVQAKGHAIGTETWFLAEVTSIRRHRFPPVGVTFTASLTGNTNPLLLPSPLTAHLPLTHLRPA